MAKVSFISPQLLIKKVSEFLKNPTQPTKAKEKFEEEILPSLSNNKNTKSKLSKSNLKTNIQPSFEEIREMETASLLDELDAPAKLNITLRDVKIISTSLMYFQKYLKSKGHNEKAQEVSDVDKKLFEFINAMEKKQ